MNSFTKAHGTLKIFLGMAPGVGKTYTMIKAGFEQQQMGRTVLIGVVESDEQSEAQNLLQKMTQVKPLIFSVDNQNSEELDVENIILQKPDIVLVDRMEHINSPGAVNRFRYQDIEQILEAGISVYTTLNVHHIESLIDVVRQVTGVICHETVPDRLFEHADEIELVDMPTDKLLTKYQEGRITLPDYLKKSAHEFYRKSNLIALREITLRRLARRVNLELTEYMQRGPKGLKSAERILVAVSASPHCPFVIRFTDRFASSIDASWMAVHVQTPGILSAKDQEQLRHNFQLISELGGDLITVIDSDITSALLQTAKQRDISHIVVGKPAGLQKKFPYFPFSSFIPRLIKSSGPISVHVVREKDSNYTSPSFRNSSFIYQHRDLVSAIKSYSVTIAITIISALLCLFLDDYLNYHSIGMLMLLSVMGLSFFTLRKGPLIVASAISAFAWNYLFIPPRMGLIPYNGSDLFLLGFYLIISIVGILFTSKLQQKDAIVKSQEKRSTALFSFVNDIFSLQEYDDIIRQTIRHLSTTFNARATFYGINEKDELETYFHPASTGTRKTHPEDRLAAETAFQTKKAAGASTSVNHEAHATYYPLVSGSSVEGILGIEFPNFQFLSSEDESLLLMCIHQATIALEKHRLQTRAQKAQLLMESDRLYKTLFNSLSHEFRTPLATIWGASSSLIENSTGDNSKALPTLASDIFNAAERLNRLVANLLDMSRIEAGTFKVKPEWCDILDLLNEISNDLKNEIKNNPLKTEISDQFPLLKIDGVLITQAILNIVLNAIQHSPSGAVVTLCASVEQNIPTIRIFDNGPGFAPDVLPHIFKKFYRAPHSGYPGTGLGLSIAKGFIEAHDGTVEAGNKDGFGAEIIIRLPGTPQSFG